MERSGVLRIAGLTALILLICSPLQVARGQVESSDSLSIKANSIIYDDQFIYIAGSISNYRDQSLVNPLNLSGGMDDMVLIKMGVDGTLIYSAVIGGSNDDEAISMTVDQGIVYLLGETWSTDFPGAPGNAGESDAVLCAIAADGSGLLWSQRFGGIDQDGGRSVITYQNNLYLTGITWSDNLGEDTALGSSDGFLAQVKFSGEVGWLKRFGGSGLDAPFDLTVAGGFLWVGGQTFSRDFSGTLYGNGDAFAAQFTLGGDQLYAGVYGGSDDDFAFAVCPLDEGGIVMTGGTHSDDMENAVGEFHGNFDAVVFQLTSDGGLETAAYMGGSEAEYGQDIINLPSGGYFVIGWTESAVFSSINGDQANSHGQVDVFIVRMDGAAEHVDEVLIGGGDDDFAKAGVLVSGELWLAGDFPSQGLGYALLISSEILGVINAPTATPSGPTATNAMTATLAPTETPAPTQTHTPTSDLMQALTASAEFQKTADASETEDARTTREESVNTLVNSPTMGPAGGDASSTDVPSSSDGTVNLDEDGGKMNAGVIVGGIVLVIVLASGGYYWFRRQKLHNE